MSGGPLLHVVSALLYVVASCLVIWGFVVWLKVSRTESAPVPVSVSRGAGQ